MQDLKNLCLLPSGPYRTDWVADFETTTQAEDCRVWVWGACNVSDPDLFVHGKTVETFVNWCATATSVIHFHNLAFDMSFIFDYIMKDGYVWVKENPRPGQFTTLISNMGKFYSVEVAWRSGFSTEFRDSLKKLPMSVSMVAKTFQLEEGKGDIDYHLHRPVGWEPTPEELDYLRRDVQIIAKALKQQMDEGMHRLTVGADSLAEYKELFSKKKFAKYFPVLGPEMDDEIRLAYRGGFTYADKRFKGTMQGEGKVYDVNSLYPYIMYDRLLPYGVPSYHEGLPPKTKSRPLFITSVTFTAKLKPDHIPCIQVKNNRIFLDTEYLEYIPEPVTLFCTNVDLELWEKHYDLDIISFNGGWSFKASKGFFHEYIEKWMEVKATSTGGRRAIAKLHLNSLYGKFATNPNVTGKIPYLDGDTVKLKIGEEETRNPVYTAMGVFITAYARQLTISAAQENYDVFAYADTDSLHLLTSEHPKNLDIDDHKLGAWAHEGDFTQALYMRAKAYCELMADGKYSTHIAGLPESVTENLTFDDLVSGNHFAGKLSPKRVPGGIVLKDVGFTLKF